MIYYGSRDESLFAADYLDERGHPLASEIREAIVIEEESHLAQVNLVVVYTYLGEAKAHAFLQAINRADGKIIDHLAEIAGL